MDILKAEIARKRKLIEEKELVDVSARKDWSVFLMLVCRTAAALQ